MSFKIKEIQYEISSPCQAKWDEMVGDEKCRHCSLCDKQVYNFSAMNQSEIDQLLAQGKTPCTRVFKREDGTILTADCPVGLALVKSQLKKKKFLLASITLMSLLGFWLFSSFNSPRTMGEVSTKVKTPPQIMGKIVTPLEPEIIMGDIEISHEQ